MLLPKTHHPSLARPLGLRQRGRAWVSHAPTVVPQTLHRGHSAPWAAPPLGATRDLSQYGGRGDRFWLRGDFTPFESGAAREPLVLAKAWSIAVAWRAGGGSCGPQVRPGGRGEGLRAPPSPPTRLRGLSPRQGLLGGTFPEAATSPVPCAGDSVQAGAEHPSPLHLGMITSPCCASCCLWESPPWPSVCSHSYTVWPPAPPGGQEGRRHRAESA